MSREFADGTGLAWSSRIEPEDDTTVETRLLRTLQDLMELPALELSEALNVAASHITAALHCEKVDAFVFDQKKQTLRAVGTSDTPMGRLQRALGLDALPLANGGSVVEVFKTGNSYLEGNAACDPNELRGLVKDLGVRSGIAAAFDINGVRRGVLSAVSAKTDFFLPRDLLPLTSPHLPRRQRKALRQPASRSPLPQQKASLSSQTVTVSAKLWKISWSTRSSTHRPRKR